MDSIIRKVDSKWLEVDSKFIKVDSKLGEVDGKYQDLLKDVSGNVKEGAARSFI
ncbi:hypothetical protein ACSU6B_10720 [Neobacillus sp. C211]|uniref:hypothetical protein n=1 Tax=unclassified Neobacillus TaxID=2675272 RepID=UPI00397C5E29